MNKLAKYLKHRGISQRFLAKKLGIRPNTLNHYILGYTMPTLRIAYDIEKLTGGLVTMYDWVLENEKKEKQIEAENHEDLE